MSTNGAILRQTDAGAFGVYHHWDSYPNGLGKKLWSSYHGHFKQDLTAMLHYLIDEHPAGWSTILEADFRRKAGYNELFTGKTFVNGKETPEYLRYKAIPRCFCHGERHDPVQIVCLQDKMPWSYVFDIEKNRMEVYTCEDTDNPVAGFSLDGPEPNWGIVECGENYERCHHYAWKHFPELADNPSGQLGTLTYLGKRPFRYSDAHAFLIDGQRYKKGGCGYNSSYYFSRNQFYGKPNLWVESVIARNGRRIDKPVAIVEQEGYVPYPGVHWIFPPTLTKPKETIR